MNDITKINNLPNLQVSTKNWTADIEPIKELLIKMQLRLQQLEVEIDGLDERIRDGVKIT